MSQRTLEAHYKPNWHLTRAMRLSAYNCGYAAVPGKESFDDHQRSLVWQLLSETRIGPTSTVLDVGCGIGGPTRWIHERYGPARLIGIEYCASSAFAAAAQWNGHPDRPRFLQGDAQQLPIGDETVDVVFNLESALHYANKDAFLRECFRVLKPGGTLCLGDITRPRGSWTGVLSILNMLPGQFNSCVWLWSSEKYKATFQRVGFNLVHHENASKPIADSLTDGLEELRKRSWRASRGFRGRRVFLSVLRKLLATGGLAYDLFTVRRGDSEPTRDR